MSNKIQPHYADPKGTVIAIPGRGILFAQGTTVPTDATAGFAPGCLFFDVDASAGSQVFVNEGSATSCDFNPIALSGVTLAALTVTAGTITTLTSTTAAITTATLTTSNVTVENRGIGASTAAAGSLTGDAGALPAGTATVYPTTGADDTKGVVISASDKVTGRTLFIGNGVSNKILKVYPPSGGTINGAAGDAAFSSASGKGVFIVCLSSASNTWLAM